MRLAPSVIALTILGTTLGLAGCGQKSEQRPEELYLDFNSISADSPLSSVKNDGGDKVKINVHTAGGSEKAVAAPGLGEGQAVRFPPYNGGTAPSASILVVAPAGKKSLDPGAQDFSFGASFDLDPTSEGTPLDNGNNLVQRGVYAGPAQFKLQVDSGRPSCRVHGDDGDVTVQAPEPVAPHYWYTVTCTRTDAGLTLRVRAEDRGPSAGIWRKPGPTGRLSFEGAPLTVGGKVDDAGTPIDSADQFNGVVDNVFFKIGP